jgi:hypothetical protein
MMRFLLLAVFAMLVCIGQLDAKPKKFHLCRNAEIQRDSRLRSEEAKACLDRFILENNDKNTWLGCGPGKKDISCCEGDPPGMGVAICEPLN